MKLALSIYRIVLVSLLLAWLIVEPSLATMVYLVYGVMLFFAWIAYYDGLEYRFSLRRLYEWTVFMWAWKFPPYRPGGYGPE
jgi:hypothetical protein